MTGNLFPSRFRDGHQNRKLNTNFRRNGKLQSCEPCRKGKLRCDHMTPTCGRCLRRGRDAQCVYHPAPLTKAAVGNGIPTPQTADESSPSAVLQSAEIEFAASSNRSTRITESDLAPQLRFTRASSLPTQTWSSLHYGQQTVEELRRPVPAAHKHSRLAQPSTAFIQHAAILAENELSIGIHHSDNDTVSAKPSRLEIERGAAVLSLLKDMPIYLRYVDKWFSFARGIILIEPMVRIMTSGISSYWGKWLVDTPKHDLRLMSEKIWDNTLKPMSRLLNRNTTAREFCTSVTGEYLRWETVGIVLTLVALLCGSLSDGDPIFCTHDAAPIDRAATLLKTHNASNICVEFCDDWGVLNDLSLWLLYENSVVYCAMRTRGSYENWKKAGTVMTALAFCNLHEEIRVDDHTPFWMAEIRKRLLCCVYQSDKYSAIYNGRPPRLTRQYCSLQVPLDLSDSQLMLDGPDLEKAIAALDDQGFNRRGAVQRCTLERLFVADALITEEILEISMGVLPISAEEILKRAADIEQRAIDRWDSLPEFLKLDDNQPFLDTRRPPIELLFLAYIRMDVHYHHFLLQRTLIKKVGHPPTKLLQISRDMFNFVLKMIKSREIFRDFQIDFIGVLNQNGIPSAAVIAVELLHQEQNNSSLFDPESRLPRSQTIQDLSVFVAHLGNVQPTSGGYISSERGHRFLKKILDTILDPVVIDLDNNMNTEFGDLNFNDPLLQTGDGNFMQFLVDWEQDNNWPTFN
ncbi:hypothetical protein CC80DRAFT_149754 [Byssothecium circinans]|uniref:Zn(2)-C6 fungal-type domain-containing protein n=1 Tax=Byssothecium circinans TaxID=147558 RepID=A0A6A5TWX9_9PLEO|nr:hypothetical protein CC80DRAFT_149754 [Byssothecium circinans]